MHFLPSRPAGRIKKRRRPAHHSWTDLRRFFGFWMGCGHRCRNAICGRTPTKPGVSKGGLCLPFGTQPCLQGVVCYTCWRGWQGKRGAIRQHTAYTGRKMGRSFVSRWEQISCSFSESGGRYIIPRPSSFVPRRAGTKCPKGATPVLPKSKGAGNHPCGLPALMTEKKNRAGRSMAAHLCAVHLNHWQSRLGMLHR